MEELRSLLPSQMTWPETVVIVALFATIAFVIWVVNR